MSSGCQSQDSAAAAALQASHARRALLKVARDGTCSSSPSIFEPCAHPNDPSMAMFVAAALFGDGAAGVVLRASPDGVTAGAAIGRWYSRLVSTLGETRDI